MDESDARREENAIFTTGLVGWSSEGCQCLCNNCKNHFEGKSKLTKSAWGLGNHLSRVAEKKAEVLIHGPWLNEDDSEKNIEKMALKDINPLLKHVETIGAYYHTNPESMPRGD